MASDIGETLLQTIRQLSKVLSTSDGTSAILFLTEIFSINTYETFVLHIMFKSEYF